MTEPLVVVPAKRPSRTGQFWLLLALGLLWLAQGLTDLAVSWGYVLPRWLGFAGAAAGLLFTFASFLLHLAAPSTLSGFAILDRSTHRASAAGDLR